MGRSHVLISAAAWLVAAPPVVASVGHSLSGPALAASTTVCAAAALGPDWDHPRATFARTLGPVTALVAGVVSVLGGGHRQRTHTLAAAALVTAAATLLTTLPRQIGGIELPPNWGCWALLGFCAYTLTVSLGIGLRRSPLLGDLANLVVAAGLTVLAAHTVTGTWWWLPAAIGTGWLLHCIQDALTGGCPQFWWPLTGLSFRLAGLRTGGMVETGLAVAAGITVGWCVVLGSPLT